MEEADSVLEELLTRRPDFLTEFVRTMHLFVDQDYMAQYLDGLRKAGVS